MARLSVFARNRMRRHPDRRDNSVIRSAPADVAIERMLDFRFRWRRVLPQQRHARQNHPWRAISALHRIGFDERFLDRMQPPTIFQPLDSRDLLARCGTHRRDARSFRNAVDQYGASAALSLTAAVFRSSEVELIAKNEQQRALRLVDHTETLAINDEVHVHALILRPLDLAGHKLTPKRKDQSI